MEVSTTEYEFSHGKKPRGYGYWAFFFDNDPTPQFYAGTYAVAKQTAIKWAVTIKATRIKVGS